MENWVPLLFEALLPYPAFLKFWVQGLKWWAVSLDATFFTTIQSLIEFYWIFSYNISLAWPLSLSPHTHTIFTETIPHNHTSPPQNLPPTAPVLVQAFNILRPKYCVSLASSLTWFYLQSLLLDHMSNTNWIVVLSYSRIFTGWTWLSKPFLSYLYPPNLTSHVSAPITLCNQLCAFAFGFLVESNTGPGIGHWLKSQLHHLQALLFR